MKGDIRFDGGKYNEAIMESEESLTKAFANCTLMKERIERLSDGWIGSAHSKWKENALLYVGSIEDCLKSIEALAGEVSTLGYELSLTQKEALSQIDGIIAALI